MSSFPKRGLAPQPQLKLFSGGSGGSDQDAAAGPISPSMSLSQFFEWWYLPVVLRAAGASEATIGGYREALDWWARLTGDPPIAQIDEFVVATFMEQMRSATYRRGPRGKLWPVAKPTADKHFRQLSALIARTGPTLSRKRPGKNLVAEPPCIAIEAERRRKPKPPFPMPTARRIYAACSLMKGPAVRGVSAPARYRVLVALLYYVGVRLGTTMKLRTSMIELRDGEHWLNIPGSIVDKTSKSLEKRLHPAALEAIEEARGRADETDPLLVPRWPNGERWMLDQHEQLQQRAGVPEEKRLSFQGWRRTHSIEMGKLGATVGLKVAQHSLDHANDRTTSEHYADLESILLPRLPRLDAVVLGDEPLLPAAPDPQRRLF